jgi:hypothetical protein
MVPLESNHLEPALGERGALTAERIGWPRGSPVKLLRRPLRGGPLDFHYTASWPTTPEPIRWLLAATDTVGPSPTLAPMALAFIALALLFATLRHPALDAVSRERD